MFKGFIPTYKGLHRDAKRVVKDARFHKFMMLWKELRSLNWVLIQELIECFWDTTSTFNMLEDEMVTPLDFYMLMWLALERSH